MKNIYHIEYNMKKYILQPLGIFMRQIGNHNALNLSELRALRLAAKSDFHTVRRVL